jgi:lipopolysaccharide transport system ATP-binding protein
MSVVIKVENLSKQYRLGNVGLGSLSHDLNRWYQTTLRGKDDPYLKIGETNDRSVNGISEYVWALRQINFEVKQGEVLGIIGRNGAGKSTLLKILSRTTSPTTGQIKIKGRVASLLEVGTGFHPELTGRENIFLNGAILGMTKKEIKSKFDEIVDFAGVERYIDTPVKRYSSGMYVRLAFAVAAHLEPEILIVDEVLAVGDAEFQKKAIGKMRDISEDDGRTVLFVSHNMQTIGALTNRCLLMRNGTIEKDGNTSEIIQEYYKFNFHGKKEYSNIVGNDTKPKITSIVLKTSHPNNIQETNKAFSIKFTINVPKPLRDAAISYQIFNSKNDPVLHILNLNSENNFCNEKGIYELESVIPKLSLYPDDYYLVVHFADNFSKQKFETLEGVCPFEIKIFEEVRDYYWNKNNAVYIEDNFWKTQHIPG